MLKIDAGEVTVPVRKILAESKRLLEEKGWTKGVYARDAEGTQVSCVDSTATCFCMLGAINRVVNTLTGKYTRLPAEETFAIDALVTYLRDSGTATDIPTFNDTVATSVEEVAAAFDKAAEELVEAGDRKLAVVVTVCGNHVFPRCVRCLKNVTAKLWC